MQAGLKCDQVPRRRRIRRAPRPLRSRFSRKKVLIATGWRGNMMQSTDDFDPKKVARSLLRRSRQGALATLMTGSGNPYCSLVNVASHPDGSPILLISRLALHTRNILGDSRVSLMLDERTGGDPLEGSRIMLAGGAEEAGGGPAGVLRRGCVHR